MIPSAQVLASVRGSLSRDLQARLRGNCLETTWLNLLVRAFDFRDDRRCLQSPCNPGPILWSADKIADLRNIFRDAYSGWLEIEQEAA